MTPFGNISGKLSNQDKLCLGNPRFSLTFYNSYLFYSLSYGHGVLRNPDPRFIALQEFCESKPELLNSPIIQLVKKVIVPRS